MPLPIAGRFFQLGYVTRDMDRAIALYRERYGVADFLRFDTSQFAAPGSGPGMDVALAYKNGVMIELIRPAVGAEGIYIEALRADGGVNLHHLGYLVDDLAALENVAGLYKANGIDVPVQNANPTGVSLIYADTRGDNGLYSEYVFTGGSPLFDQIPHN